jgi:ATP phosphoribosyltransferase regulatory subunit
MTVEGLRALGLGRFQIDVGQADFFRGILEDLAVEPAVARELRDALGRKDLSALERLVADLAAPAAATELLLALPALYGRGDVLERAERLVKSARSEAALGNLAEVYRLLRAYGLADSVLLDLGEVRGFDYYSGVHFEAYVTGLGAPLVGGGRYDQMLAHFGYDCPATGFAFDIGRALLALASQGAEPALSGPDFFVIDFTADKTRALAISRRLRDAGAAVARDIISRPLAESLVYARGQRAACALVIGEDGADPDRIRVIDLSAGGAETGARTVRVDELLADPRGHFPGLGGRDA